MLMIEGCSPPEDVERGPPKSPTITVTDQKGEKGSSIDFSFTIEKANKDLVKDKVHIAKASKNHKFTEARFKVQLSGDTSKLTGEASADSLTCDDQSGYIVYYERIPRPPKHGPPAGGFMLQIEGCPPPKDDETAPGYPKITVKDQKGEKGGSISFSFTVDKSAAALDKDQIHIDKASKDHKFTNARFKVELSGDTSEITGEASADSLTCDDQSGYIIYYQRIPPPPKEGPPPGGFMLQIEGCPPPEDNGPPAQDPIITVDQQQQTTKGGTLTFTFKLESNDKTLTKDKVHMVKSSQDHKMSPVRFTLTYEVSSDSKTISGTAVAANITCDDQSGYLIYYNKLPPPPHQETAMRFRRQPKPPPGGFLINVQGCSHY